MYSHHHINNSIVLCIYYFFFLRARLTQMIGAILFFALPCQKENMALIEVYICVVLHACKTMKRIKATAYRI